MLNRCIIIALLVVTAILAERYDDDNDPSNFSNKYKYNLSQLPRQGALKKEPWSDSYWPSFQGGIAYRWNNEKAKRHGFNYTLHKLPQLKAMAPAEIAQLSPAEKYDIYRKRYDYPTVRSEWKRTDPGDDHWEGLCHGWAPASLHYRQPKPVNVTNMDGIVIQFGSSDIKALLTYWVGIFMPDSDIWFVGTRCDYDILHEDKKYINVSECSDTNAGGFHVSVVNDIGVLESGRIVADVERSYEVWNMPLASYKYNVTELPSSNGVKKSLIDMELKFSTEIEPNWHAVQAAVESTNMTYTLEMNANGRIIGGNYHTYPRMDFMWELEILDFTGYFSLLKKLFAKSIAEPEQPFGVVKPLFGKRNADPMIARDGKITVEGYGKRETKIWYIKPTGTTKKIGFKVVSLNVEKIWDTVKIYEGMDGPLVAVLHGSKMPTHDIIVESSDAYVVFASDKANVLGGFELEYYSV
jgi:hypothetical protein